MMFWTGLLAGAAIGAVIMGVVVSGRRADDREAIGRLRAAIKYAIDGSWEHDREPVYWMPQDEFHVLARALHATSPDAGDIMPPGPSA